MVTQVQQHDRQLGLQDIRLAELDLRFQILETASYNGILMWKIRDYSRRKQEAITGRTVSLYSQPFYTSRFGYKMCARLYLNGDGMGKGTHLSLFFVVMRSEYDALLPWPFHQRSLCYSWIKIKELVIFQIHSNQILRAQVLSVLRQT